MRRSLSSLLFVFLSGVAAVASTFAAVPIPKAPSIDARSYILLDYESGRVLGELGVRPEDGNWIREHADTIASLASRRPRRRFAGFLYRLARRAERTAR